MARRIGICTPLALLAAWSLGACATTRPTTAPTAAPAAAPAGAGAPAPAGTHSKLETMLRRFLARHPLTRATTERPLVVSAPPIGRDGLPIGPGGAPIGPRALPAPSGVTCFVAGGACSLTPCTIFAGSSATSPAVVLRGAVFWVAGPPRARRSAGRCPPGRVGPRLLLVSSR